MTSLQRAAGAYTSGSVRALQSRAYARAPAYAAFGARGAAARPLFTPKRSVLQHVGAFRRRHSLLALGSGVFSAATESSSTSNASSEGLTTPGRDPPTYVTTDARIVASEPKLVNAVSVLNWTAEALLEARECCVCMCQTTTVGDLHGDWNKALDSFRLAELIKITENGEVEWTGGDTVVVQLGDVLDRGDNEICGWQHTGPTLGSMLSVDGRLFTMWSVCPHAAIVRLLRGLDKQARQHGGAVYMLNGNHETLNLCGDFRCAASRGWGGTPGALLCGHM